MLHARWSALTLGRVNPLVPGVILLAGLACAFAGPRAVGLGICVGAVLASFNGLFLSQRVEVAADQGEVGRALLVMQAGFLITCSVVALATIILVKIALSMAVACALAFFVTQTALLGTYFWGRARKNGTAPFGEAR